VADFLVDHLISETSKLYDDFSDEIAGVNLVNASSEKQMWQLFFDGVSKTNPK